MPIKSIFSTQTSYENHEHSASVYSNMYPKKRIKQIIFIGISI